MQNSIHWVKKNKILYVVRLFDELIWNSVKQTFLERMLIFQIHEITVSQKYASNTLSLKQPLTFTRPENYILFIFRNTSRTFSKTFAVQSVSVL